MRPKTVEEMQSDYEKAAGPPLAERSDCKPESCQPERFTLDEDLYHLTMTIRYAIQGAPIDRAGRALAAVLREIIARAPGEI